jgi:3-oxoacyl-[acyl-carrier protein] reductase
MDHGITGRVALIMGGSSGLGLAIAKSLADEGAIIELAGRDAERADAAAAGLRAGGHDAIGTAVDAVNEAAVSTWVDDVVKRRGRLDIVVANAGGPRKATATQATIDEYRAAAELNLFASIRLTHLTLPHLRAGEWGRVIYVGSRSVREPIPALALSNTARAGLLGYMKSLVRDLGPAGVTVNMLAPGQVLTERMARGLGELPSPEEIAKSIPLGRYGRPEEFGAAALFLASEQAGFITGVVLPVDGGIIRAL